MRRRYLPSDRDGLLFVAPLREDFKCIYETGGSVDDAIAPSTQDEE